MKTSALRILAMFSTALTLAFGGCATGGVSLRKPDFSKISAGMSKEEVFARLGKPHQTALDNGVESLLYGYDAIDGVMEIQWFTVNLAGGRVVAYGPSGIHAADTSALQAMAAHSQVMVNATNSMNNANAVQAYRHRTNAWKR